MDVDPKTPGLHFQAVKIQATIEVDNHFFIDVPVGTVQATGTATAAPTIAINLLGFKSELLYVINSLVQGSDGKVYYLPDDSPAPIEVSSRFLQLARNVLPWANPSPIALAEFLDSSRELLSAVARDFSIANFRISAESTGDVNVNWHDLFVPGVGLIYGVTLDYGRRDPSGELASILSPSNQSIGNAAKQWALLVF